jgi:hypothetical protein
MPRFNAPVPLALQLWDKASGKYVRATVRLPSGQKLDGSPVGLDHVENGYYTSNDLRMPNVEYVTCFYEVFDDAAHTIPSADHSEAFELLELSSEGGGGGDSDQIIAEIYDSDVSLVAHVEEARTLRGVI